MIFNGMSCRFPIIPVVFADFAVDWFAFIATRDLWMMPLGFPKDQGTHSFQLTKLSSRAISPTNPGSNHFLRR